MRVGINTGEVLVGTLAGSDYTAMGDVVNTAARLQALAPPGGVLIGSATAALCSVVHRHGAASASLRSAGRDRVEESWLVIGALAAGARPVRWDVPFVGRAPERSLLDAAVQLVRNGHSGVVSIIGEPGAGKTRLAEEIVDTLEAEAIVVRTACAPYGEQDVWAPVVTGLTGLFGLERDATAETVRLTMERRAQEVWGLKPGRSGARALPRRGFLPARTSIGVRPPRRGRRPRPAGGGGHRDAASQCPDPDDGPVGRQPAVGRPDAARSPRRHRAVAARLPLPPHHRATARPDVQWPPTVERPLVVQVPLGPLERADCLELVRSMLATREQGGHDDAGVEALVDRGGGNPLFLVELAALAASCADAATSCRARCAPSSPPASTSCPACSGRSSTTPRSSASTSTSPRWRGSPRRWVRTSDVTDLDDLACAGLIELEGRRWQFRSDVVREVVYQTLTKRVRAQRHAGVAAVMAAGGYSVDDVAQHAATAAELLVELGPVDGVKPSIIGHAIDCAARGRQVGRRDRPLSTPPIASPAGGSTSTAPTRRRSASCCCVRATAELERRRFGDASPTPRPCSNPRWPTGIRVTRARRGAASARSPRCRATS